MVMCKVIDETSEGQSNNYDMEIGQKQSILYNYGYNVQTKKNLSGQQRHWKDATHKWKTEESLCLNIKVIVYRRLFSITLF
jgi:hypothetical protein